MAARVLGKGPNGFGYGSTAEEVTAGVDLTGKTVLVTGTNTGLGFETLRVLSMRGAHVVAAARTDEKARDALRRAGATGTPVACDLGEPRSVRDCAAAVRATGRRLDAIVCNAGIMALPRLELLHGYEAQFFTNHIGHFLLVTELLETLADDGRVVILSSDAHRAAPREGIDFDNLRGEKSYGPWKAYGRSKLANLLCARELARRFEGTKRTANAVHPGVIATDLTRHMNPLVDVAYAVCKPLFLKTIPQGAATQCYLAAHPDGASFNGAYFANCNPARSRAAGRDMDLARRLWDRSEQILAELADRVES